MDTTQRPFASSDLKVLVVEDNSDARRLITRMLVSLGYERIVTACDGEEALAALERRSGAQASGSEPIDVVLCDWNMPSISGLDVLERVRSFAPNLPFILMTGETDETAFGEATKRGATSHLLKPFSKDVLSTKMAVIERILEARAA